VTNAGIIQNWIRAYFSDQKLAEVYAFNEDRKMRFQHPCACILGVTFCINLHDDVRGCMQQPREHWNHYIDATSLPGAAEVERAYLSLGLVSFDWIARLRMRWILRSEMKRRERLRQVESERTGAEVTSTSETCASIEKAKAHR